MAATQQVVWTAIPNGIKTDPSTGDKLRVAVHASLRGNGDGVTLNSYPAFLHWATQTASVGFDLTLNLPGAQTKPATRVSASPVAVVWDSLFPANMKVNDRTQAKSYANHRVISYPARHIHDYLRDMHVNAAVDSGESFVGLLEWFENHTGDLGYGHDNQKDLQRLLLNLAGERGEEVNGKPKRYNDFPADDHQKAFAALREFHAPRQLSPDDEADQQPIALPVFDFHQALSLIGEHAPLMRLLGLAFDLEVALSAFTGITVGGSDGTISVAPTSFTPSGSFSSVLPRTRVRVSTTEFHARTNNPAHDRGHLVLGGNTPSYDVLRVDVDAAGLKTAHTADSTALSQSVGQAPKAKKQNNAPDAPQEFSLPTMRSAGFQVVRDDQAPRFVERIDRSKQLTDTLPNIPDLDATDITKGYVLDVYDNVSGRWRTTAARTGTYAFPGAVGFPPVSVEDQAPFDSVPTGSTDPNAAEEFNLQPSLIRWDGWSLAGARPGKALADDGTPLNGPGSSSQIPVEINLKAKPGSLPLLRFGRTYRLRLRTVSIAGTGVALEEGANSGPQVSPEQAYLRHDPVPSPDVHTRDQAVPGETVRTLVIRGNHDTDATDAAKRTIAPPRVAMQLAETHGMFDVGGVPAKAKYTQIAGREAKHFDKDLEIDVTAPVPYLPDVLARGAVLRGDGALASKTITFNFDPGAGGQWPDLRPFRLELHGADAAGFEPDGNARVVKARLTKGDEATIKLSCKLDEGDIPLLGLHEWITQKGKGSDALKAKLLGGSLWSFTPYQTIKLVYAVRQPLIAPSFGGGVGRALGATSADISGGMNFSRKSTSRLDVQAAWTEQVDDITKSGPQARPFAAKAFEVPIPAPVNGGGGLNGVPGAEQNGFSFKRQHEFGDTRHRVVEYKVLGTSKFAEHFKGHVELPTVGVVDQPKLISAEGLDVRSVVVKKVGAVQPATSYEAHADGTITFRSPTFSAGTTGVTVDFTPNVTRLTEGDGARISVPSSARPKAPEVVDVVPILQWSGEVKSTSIKSTKSASAFRIFIDRPWFSSGDGEQLGVVLFRDPAPLTSIDDSLQRYVTEWGADPVFKGNVLPNFHPKVGNFPKRVTQATGLVLDEVPASRLKVDVAGHEVSYDAERKLWYCDVVVNTGAAYTPFVRLVVARYQPSSIAGVELSRTVQLDIMQVAPGRTITVTRTGTGANTIQKVSMSGYDYTDGPESTPPKANYLISPHGLSRVQVVVERRNTSYKADQLMGWTEHKTYEMKRSVPKNFVYTWATTQPITLPKGPVRLVVRQFEWVASDGNRYDRVGTGFRLVHQDIINPRAVPQGTIKTG